MIDYIINVLKNDSLFNLGIITITCGIDNKMKHDTAFEIFVLCCLEKHRNGDWGCLPPEDAKLNDEALIEGERLLSAYQYNDSKIWIITEWDRSRTTVLFPDEY